MKKVNIGVIIIFILSSVMTNEITIYSFHENGRTLYVGGTGPDNYTCVQDAIDAANDGDTIFVYSGTYYENIVINKSINLIGENKETTIIDGEKKGNVIYVCGNGVHISNFTIQHGGGGWPGAGIFIYSSDNVISNNIIRNNGKGIIIMDLVSKHNKICKNTVVNNTETGIDLFNADGNIIKENNVLRNGGDGIAIADAGFNIIEKNVLADTIYLGRAHRNIVKDNSFSEKGIRIWYSSGNKLLNNTINGKPIVYLEGKTDAEINEGAQVILIGCERITIKNLDISNTCCAIHLSFCNKCTIEENILKNNSYNIEMYSCKNNLIEKNKIFNSTHDGIYLWDSYKNVLKKNIFKNNRCGITLSRGSSMNKILNNNFIENEIHATFYFSFHNWWLRNYWDNWEIPLPKPIFGFPWIQLDWMPRLSPYGGEE
ncbi:MAG: hypothetical protein DRN11_01805 [Thermoplasmata archaeon]|nr:MAG: hypothetical protein DRN11_01805 [Thermoplasmata archaeon]